MTDSSRTQADRTEPTADATGSTIPPVSLNVSKWQRLAGLFCPTDYRADIYGIPLHLAPDDLYSRAERHFTFPDLPLALTTRRRFVKHCEPGWRSVTV